MCTGKGAIKVKSLFANTHRNCAASVRALEYSKQANLAFNNLPFKNIHKMITTCVNIVHVHHKHIHGCTHLHTHTRAGKKEPLIASVKNLHAGHLCESLLVEMKGAGASKPCVLSVP